MTRSLRAPWVRLPAEPARAIARPRVVQALDEACQAAPVVSVVAGAGYGKTTALADWARRMARERPVAWVDARQARHAPGGLCQAIWVACQQAVAREDLALEPEAIAPTGAVGVRQILDLLEGSARPLLLIIDDLHDVRDRGALESLDLLIAYLPEGTILVVSSRWGPPLRLARPSLQDRLREITARDLAFDPAETQRLLEAHGVATEAATVRRLTRLAEGWPVALRLASTALAGGADVAMALDEFSGQGGQFGVSRHRCGWRVAGSGA